MSRTELAGKVFNDPIHGHIELHPLCVRIIDTPQFQRLRYLKQLGGCYFVYPGASHNRFEHSLGVCHLAGELVRALHERQPELKITNEDILCVEIAGLCHDLGHGAFSHLFDNMFIPYMCPDKKWKHEDASTSMLDYLIDDNNLLPVFIEYGLNEQDIIFIKEQIAGPSDDKMWPYSGRSEEKSFLYEIVANKKNGIDVDKWDYFARDCHMLGIRNNFDHTRFIRFTRVLKVDGSLQICPRDKEVNNLYDMFHTRHTLHRRAYQHKTVNIIETMIKEAMVIANDYIQFVGEDGKSKTMVGAVEDMDMVAFSQITDHIFVQILHSTEPELKDARKILRNILRRKLYKCIGQTQLKANQVLSKKDEQQIKKEIQAAIDPAELNSSPLKLDDILVDFAFLDYGMKDKNPIENVRFYMKDDPATPIKVEKEQASRMLPETFSEELLRIFCKIDDAKSIEMLKRAFGVWCEQRGFPPPKDYEFGIVDARQQVLLAAKGEMILMPGSVMRKFASTFEDGKKIHIGLKIPQNDIRLDEVASQEEDARTASLINSTRSTQKTRHSKVNSSHTTPKTSRSKHGGRNTRRRHLRGRRNLVNGIWTRYGFWEGGNKGRRPLDILASSIIGK